MGDIIRKESYVKGEEYTTGKTIEETVYDDKGNVVKSFTYNSLDTSSKFYTETEYDENGKVLAEIDETGENKTKFGYVDGKDSDYRFKSGCSNSRRKRGIQIIYSDKNYELIRGLFQI